MEEERSLFIIFGLSCCPGHVLGETPWVTLVSVVGSSVNQNDTFTSVENVKLPKIQLTPRAVTRAPG